MRYLFIIIVTLLIQTESFGASTQKNAANPFKVLVFWKTAGYPHAAIPEQITYFQAWGTKYGFDVENSNKPEIWTKDYLNSIDNVNTIFKNQLNYDLMGRKIYFGLRKSETQNGQRKFKVQ